MDILGSVTDGYFQCKPKKCPDLLSTATGGLLSCYRKEIPIIKETVSGGNNNPVFRYSPQHEVLISTRRQLIKEDQEILLIIKSFTQCQD